MPIAPVEVEIVNDVAPDHPIDEVTQRATQNGAVTERLGTRQRSAEQNDKPNSEMLRSRTKPGVPLRARTSTTELFWKLIVAGTPASVTDTTVAAPQTTSQRVMRHCPISRPC